MIIVAIAGAVWLAVAWRVLPWFIRRSREYWGDDVDGYMAAIFWPVTLVLYVLLWNVRPLHRLIERRVNR